jgi:adsorption protein A
MRNTVRRSGLRLAVLLAGMWLAVPALAQAPEKVTAQALELSDYQHFVVYPHLHKAFQAQAKQDVERALREFSRARERAPDSIPLMLFLVEAYREFGLDEQARIFLHEQLERFPGEPRLRRQLEAIPVELPRIETLEQLARQKQQCEQAPSAACRLHLAYGALRLGELQLAQAQLASVELSQQEQIKLQQAIVERAVHLREWDYLDRHYRGLQEAGKLPAKDLEPWFQVMLSAGRYQNLMELQQAGIFNDAVWQIRLASHLAEVDLQAFAAYMQRSAPHFASQEQEASWIYLLSQSPDSRQLLQTYQAQYTENRQRLAADGLPAALLAKDQARVRELLDMLPADQYLAERFAQSLAENDQRQAIRLSQRIFNSSSRSAGEIERHSWRLLRSGAAAEAVSVLLRYYPFSGSPEEREKLLVRLSELLTALKYPLGDDQLQRLQQPLAEPRLREVQVRASWMRDDCPAIVRVLSDRSPSYTAATWLQLANCQKESVPGLAVEAYEQAVQRDPAPATRIALAYQYYAVESWQAALDIWLGLPLHQLTDAQLQAATRTAHEAAADEQLAYFLTEQQRRGLDSTAQYWWLLAVHQYSRAPEQALAALEQSLQLEPQAPAYALRAQINKGAGRLDAALADLRQAIKLEPDDLQYQSALGYLLWEMQDYTAARQAHEKALAGTPTDMTQHKQLVYLNERLDDRVGVRRHAEQVIDDLYLLTGEPWVLQPEEQDVADLFAFRRMHEEAGRHWTFNLNASLGLNNTSIGARPATAAGTADKSYRSFAQVEASYLFGKNVLAFGDELSFYARMYADSSYSGSTVPRRNPVAGVGIRWKPWYNRVAFAALEQLQPLHGNNQSDTLARLSASFFNGGRFSDDWHPLGNGWLAQNLYLDAGYYMRSKTHSWTADYRVGWHHKLREGQTLEPYTRVQQQGYRDGQTQGAQIWGLGLRWNLWAGQTRYDAWPHKYSVGLERQTVLNTVGQQVRRRNSYFLVLGARW